MENLKKVIAVVVTYNRKKLLEECIEALLNQDYKNCHILIVDNASTDGTEEYISEYLKNEKVNYVNTGANLGGAGGFNYGMKEACKIGCDFMWIMDDDCIAHKDSLTKLLAANEKLEGEFGFLSSKVLWKDNSICKMNIQKRKFSKWLRDYDTNMQKIEMASFVSLFIKTQVVQEMGLPIKDFFIWTDDWEYTRRISRKYNCYYVSNSIVTHKSKLNEGASIATVDGERLERFKYMYRNDVVLYRREGIKGWILLYLRLLLHKLRILKSDKKNKKERIALINKAIKKGKKFFPKVEYVDDEQKKICIAEIFAEPLSYGGQESFIINMYENFTKENLKYIFFTPYYCDNERLKNDIQKKNCDKLIYMNKSFNSKFRKIIFMKELKKFLKNNKNIDIAHIHSGSIFALAKGAKICNKHKIKRIIVHSHCTGIENKKHKIIKKVYEKYFLKYATDFFACSKDAAEFKFPQEIIKKNKYFIAKNGIDIDKFEFNNNLREKYRNKMNLNNNLVLINIGRMEEQKNQIFLIDIMNDIVNNKKRNDIKLIIVGTGNLENIIKRKIDDYNLNKNIILLKNRKDVKALLDTSDLFVFPSIYEGLGIVAIEAQANGLPTLCSEFVPLEANVTSLFIQEKLIKGISAWSDLIENMLKKSKIRENMNDIIKAKGYDVKEAAKLLEEKYLEENMNE